MGIVYKARQPRLDRFVALKMILRGANAASEDLARFEAEAQAVAAIEHPNIVRIFEIGEHHRLPYFSLEYLAGGSLARTIGGKPQPVAEATRITEVLARAMYVAHRAWGRPPRFEAGQRVARRRWHNQDQRLRPGQTARKRLGADQERIDSGHSQLHGTRAGQGRYQARRSGGRPVRLGRDPVRAPHRPPALPGYDRARDPRSGPEQRAAAAVAAPAQDPARRRDDLPQVPGKRARAPLWRLRRTCGRPAAVSSRRANPRPGDLGRGAPLAVVSAQPAAGAARRHGRVLDPGSDRHLDRLGRGLRRQNRASGSPTASPRRDGSTPRTSGESPRTSSESPRIPRSAPSRRRGPPTIDRATSPKPSAT